MSCWHNRSFLNPQKRLTCPAIAALASLSGGMLQLIRHMHLGDGVVLVLRTPQDHVFK